MSKVNQKSLSILVTGATAGIGRHTALHLARAGHRVFATGRNTAALAELAREASGVRLETVSLDVADAASIDLARAEILRRTGGHGIDAIVNNAGYGQVGPVIGVEDRLVRAQFETNVFGLLAVTRAFSHEMLARGAGRIVNLSSVGGRFTAPFMGVYSATKYAVESLSDAMRIELAPLGVDVVVIEPGYIRTQFAATSQATLAAAVEGTRWASMAGQFERVLARFEATASGPEVVAAAIERALTARRPAARIVAPWWGGAALLVGWLPTRLADALVRLAMGIRIEVPPPVALTPA